MPRSERKTPEPGKKPAGNRSGARRSHSIRFSDTEWSLIERAAGRHGIPAGELVRTGAVAAAEDRLGEPPPATLPPGHLALIETVWRMVYVLATLDRDRTIDAGRENELDDIAAAARRTMAETVNEGPG